MFFLNTEKKPMLNSLFDLKSSTIDGFILNKPSLFLFHLFDVYK